MKAPIIPVTSHNTQTERDQYGLYFCASDPVACVEMRRLLSESLLFAVLQLCVLFSRSLTLDVYKTLDQLEHEQETASFDVMPNSYRDYVYYRKKNSSKPADSNVTESRVLRLAMFSDATLLKHLSDLAPKDPFAATHDFIAAGVSAIEDILQQGVGEDVTLKIQMVQVGVWAEQAAIPFSTNGLASSNLLSFCEWASERRPAKDEKGHWHHAILLTGKELFETTKDSLGVTFMGGMCHPRTSCSIVEATSFKAVQVAAHEVAHSMGVPHDGEGVAAPCAAKGFIMGQSLAEMTHQWSNCSKKAFKAFFKNDTCFEREKEEMIEHRVDLDHNKGGPPGQRYPADAQCQFAFGRSFKATPSRYSLCQYLMCSNGVSIRGAHPALPGTVCGTNRVCHAGQCKVSKVTPPTKPPTGPPSKPPTDGGGSSFPPATIPKEIGYIPLPHRCYFMPPFLHPYIGCSRPNRPNKPNRPNRPIRPSKPATRPMPFRMDLEGLDLSVEDNESPLLNPVFEGYFPDFDRSTFYAALKQFDLASYNSRESSEVISKSVESQETFVYAESKGVADEENDTDTSPAVVPEIMKDMPLETATDGGEYLTTISVGISEERITVEETIDQFDTESQRILQREAASDMNNVENGKVQEQKENGARDNNETNTKQQIEEETTKKPFTTETITTQTTTGRSVTEAMVTTVYPASDNFTHSPTGPSQTSPTALSQLTDTTYEITTKPSTTTEIGNVPTDEDESVAAKEDEGNAVLSLDNFNISGSGLHFAVPSHLLQDVLSPMIAGALHHDMYSRMSYLRDGYKQEPLLAATAPSHSHAFRISPCSRSCGGGTRRVTQVCVSTTAPDVVVSPQLCVGLPNAMEPFNQTCNTFPCYVPQWVVGPWSQCSKWCDLGVQRRLVACGLPLLEGSSPLEAGHFLVPGKCSGEQPIEVKLCKGSCAKVDCKLPSNTFHPACYHLLGETPVERDNEPTTHTRSQNT